MHDTMSTMPNAQQLNRDGAAWLALLNSRLENGADNTPAGVIAYAIGFAGLQIAAAIERAAITNP